ncbi:MAG TPA: PD-(D/E)XK nuclease family protein [Desulfosarcina sp.]|nr:PD-(D/E)XK nuclease family protein [Desulfosarcina sp.]
MKERHRIAVRTLVDMVLRAGDLDARFCAPGRRLDGIRAHQALQRRRPEGYRAEVPVSIEVETAELILVVGGRIDGVGDTAEETLVEEIKSTTRDLKQFAQAPDACHWGQAKVYAWLLAREERLDAVTIRLTYFHLDTGETVELVQTMTRAELQDFFNRLIERYLQWAETLTRWRRRRDAAITALDFPYPIYRTGQRDMAVTVYRTIRDGGQALIQAATGIGKTMAVLFPAIKTLGEGHVDRLFFLTARDTGKAAATDALRALQETGLRLKRVVLTAKERICFRSEASCHPEACEYARGHFDRLTAALDDAFQRDHLDRETIEAAARAHRVCPFEFSLELARWADCIVCDYNYAFDPRVYLRRFFDEENGAYAFLVDEAHNLVDRSRDMFSAHLNKEAFLEVRRAVKSHLPAVYRAAGRINAWMLDARRKTEAVRGFRSDPQPPEGLDTLLQGFLRTAERWLVKNLAAPYRDLLLENYFQTSGFLRIRELYDGGYVTCYRASGKDLQLKLFCLDPSDQLGSAMRRARAGILF